MDLPELATIHDRYLALCSPLQSEPVQHQPEAWLARKLLLRSGFDPDGIAVLVAATLAGAASLCIDADAESLRNGLRAGLCDFVVGHLDEALRILKNELRRGRPISVGLTASPAPSLQEIVARGLQPDFLSLRSHEVAQILFARGARPVPQLQQDAQTSILTWTVTTEPARSLPTIASLAADALDPNRSDTPARRRWLDQSPMYLGRAFGPRQCLRMTANEIAAFLPPLQSRLPSVSVKRDGADIPGV